MAELYVITDTRGVDQFVIKAGETNSDTDLKLPGKGAVVWGENLDENSYRLMENFAVEESSPGNSQDASTTNGNGINNPLEGQNWWNITQKKLYVFDGSNWQKIGTSTGSVAPTPASEGDLWFDDIAQQLKVYNGGAFVSTALQYLRLDGTVAMLNNLNMNGQAINFVADNPVAGTDAANKNYVDALGTALAGGSLDALYVNVTGDTMVGDLILNADPTVALQAATKQYVDAVESSLTVVINDVDGFDSGDIKASAASAIPSGFLLCDGTSYLAASFPTLFAAIGIVYGVGANDFQVPDLRGRFPMGAGTSAPLSARALGQEGGNETHTLTIAEMPAHTHTEEGNNGVVNLKGFNPNPLSVGNQAKQTGSTGGNAAHDIMNPFLAINYFIKT